MDNEIQIWRNTMDTKPARIPAPDKVVSADPEPVAVEFLATELPEHVRAFFDEQRKETATQS
jgi:hypothetical protein